MSDPHCHPNPAGQGVPDHRRNAPDESSAEPSQAHVAMRQTARGALEEIIRDGRRRVAALEALSRALPLQLDPAADEALWQILVERRR